MAAMEDSMVEEGVPPTPSLVACTLVTVLQALSASFGLDRLVHSHQLALAILNRGKKWHYLFKFKTVNL
jgi:hypothetical protein